MLKNAGNVGGETGYDIGDLSYWGYWGLKCMVVMLPGDGMGLMADNTKTKKIGKLYLIYIKKKEGRPISKCITYGAGGEKKKIYFF